MFHSEKMPGTEWVHETCQLRLTVKSMKQRQVIVVLCRLFPAETILIGQNIWMGKKQCGDIHCQVDGQRHTHSSCSRKSFKEPNFVTVSLPLKIFLHNQGENNEADMCQWRLVLKDLPVFMLNRHSWVVRLVLGFSSSLQKMCRNSTISSNFN